MCPWCSPDADLSTSTALASNFAILQFTASTDLPRYLDLQPKYPRYGYVHSQIRDSWHPTESLYKYQKSMYNPHQTRFTHQWFHALAEQSFLMQPPTNCHGSEYFQSCALFTTLLGRVRLSHSVGYFYHLNNLIQRSTNQYGIVIRKFVYSHSLGGTFATLDTGRAFIPTLKPHGF